MQECIDPQDFNLKDLDFILLTELLRRKCQPNLKEKSFEDCSKKDLANIFNTYKDLPS